jgi:hypothetical protein
MYKLQTTVLRTMMEMAKKSQLRLCFKSEGDIYLIANAKTDWIAARWNLEMAMSFKHRLRTPPFDVPTSSKSQAFLNDH